MLLNANTEAIIQAVSNWDGAPKNNGFNLAKNILYILMDPQQTSGWPNLFLECKRNQIHTLCVNLILFSYCIFN